MAAQNENALLAQAANIEIGDDAGSLVDLGSVRNVQFTGAISRIQADSDNNGTILSKVRLNGQISFDWLEAGDAANLAELFKGVVTAGTVAASIVNNFPQVVASGDWAYNRFIEFTHQDADGTVVNIDSVTAGTNGALTVNVDYMVVQDAGTLRWGIIVIDSATVTTLVQSITIQFDYTPAASQTLTGGTSQTATPRYARLIAESEDDAAVTRIIVLEECTAVSNMLLPFLDVDQAGDVGVMPVTLENNRGATWTLTDEINA